MSTRIPRPNEVVLFRKRKEPCFGIFLRSIGNSTKIFAEEGKEIDVDLNKIVLPTGVTLEDSNTQSEKKLRLRNLRRYLEEKKETIDLTTIWECLEEVQHEVKLEEVSSLYFGEHNVDDQDLMTLFWAIDRDRIYFKRMENGYEPRTAQEVKGIIAQREAEDRTKEERKNALSWAKGIIKNSNVRIQGFDPAGWIEMIKGYAIYLDKFNGAREAKSFLSEIGIRDAEGAVEFLIKAGAWEEDEDPMLKKFSVTEDFLNDVIEEASRLISELSSCEEGIEDLTHLDVFSIDDEGTEDVDDAISIEELAEGTRVGVHIANVAAHVEKWSALDIEAARRGETIYIPEKHIHMFPPILIKERLSLIKDSPRLSLSLLILFDGDNKVKSYRFTNAIVNVRENLNYEAASHYFQNNSLGKKLRRITHNLKQKRIEAGAFIVQLPQLKIKLGEEYDSGASNNRIKIYRNFMNSIAHVVVAEMMILMNRMAGRYLKDNKIPAVYRSQPEPISEDARSCDKNDPLYALQIVKYLRSTKVGLNPEPHLSLGTDVYTQVTSPIRRYADLVMQRQIVARIQEKEVSYTEDELENLYPSVEISIRNKRMIEKSRQKYWLYKYLQTLEGQRIEGIVSSTSDTRPSAYLPDFLFATQFSLGSEMNLREGDSVKLLIKKVDPLRNKIVLVAK